MSPEFVTGISADEAAALPAAGSIHREFVAQVVAANLRLLEGYAGRSAKDTP